MQSPRHQLFALGIALGAAFISAVLLARGTGYYVAKGLLAEDDAPNPRQARRFSAAHSSQKSGDRILARNIFDSETGSLLGGEETEIAATSPDVDPEMLSGDAPLCSGGETLVGIFYSYRNPDKSLIGVKVSGETYVLEQNAENDTLASGPRLVSVEPDRATIIPTSGSPCRLEMFADEASSAKQVAATPTPSPRPARPKRKGGISDAEYDAGIQKVSDTKYNVSRELLNKVLGNRVELIRSARIIPHEENGRVVGVKLYGIRRASMLSRIGLRNGDMLRTINGFDMTSPDTALEAYARLRSAERLTVSLVRNGKQVNMDYRVR